MTRLAQQHGRVEMVRLAFEAARAANPAARCAERLRPLGRRTSPIEDCLDAGITIDAIGLQTHMHQGYRGEGASRRSLERFARFGLPLHLTETTLSRGDLMPPEIVDLNDYQVAVWPSTPEGEARQADELVRHYTTLVRIRRSRRSRTGVPTDEAPGSAHRRARPGGRHAQAGVRRAPA